MAKSRLSANSVAAQIALSCNGWLYLNGSYGSYQLHEYVGQQETAIHNLKAGTLKEVYQYWQGLNKSKYIDKGQYIHHDVSLETLAGISRKLSAERISLASYTTEKAVDALTPCVCGKMLVQLLYKYEAHIKSQLYADDSQFRN